jgi:aspartate kinase
VRGELAEKPVVVVSAHAGVTDMLLALARNAAAGDAATEAIAGLHRRILADLGLPQDLLDPLLLELADLARGIRLVGAASPKALDHLASFGERCCARTTAAALRAAGVPAVAVDAFDLGLCTDSQFGRARPLPDNGRMAKAIAAVAGVPVVTGFIAKDEGGNITTLGRNGSDYTAALVGAALGADEIQVWKDVDGVRTADPRLVPTALPIRSMSFDEASELASFGSKVLHPATMLPAMARGIAVCVRNTVDPAAAGTRIVAGVVSEGAAVRAIAHKEPVAMLTLESQRMQPQHDFLARVFEALAARAVDAGPIVVSEAAVTFAVEAAPAEALLVALEPLGSVRIARNMAVLGVIGDGRAMAHGAAAQVLDTLAAVGVAVHCASQGAHAGTLALIVADSDCRRAVVALHARFFGAP